MSANRITRQKIPDVPAGAVSFYRFAAIDSAYSSYIMY